MSCSVSGSTNRIVFLSSVRECEKHKGINITRIGMRERSGVRNVSEVGLKMDEKYKQK